MASYSLFLLTLSLLTFSYQPFLLVESDDAMIQNLCNRTPEPGVCSECLHSNPSSKTADIKGLSVIAINCAEFDTNLLYNYSSSLWDNTSDSDLPLKRILDECTLHTYVARQKYHGAVRYVQDNESVEAKATINSDVIPYVNHCMDQFNENPTIPVPQRILAGTHIVNQDCQVVLGILSFFTG